MSNDTSTLNGSLLEMKDQLIYELGQKGVTASYDSSTGLLGLIGEISNIQTGGSCYHIELDQTSYTTTGSLTVSATLQNQYQPYANQTVTFTGGTSTVTATTDSNGVATATVTFSASGTLTATYSNVSDTASVTVGQATLSLATNKSILSQYHSDSATLTATYSLGAGGTVELYNSNDVKIGTFTDAGGGTYTYSLASTGVGDLSLYAKCSGVTSSNVSIEDCFLYSANETSRTSTHNTDTLISIFNDFSFTSNSYVVEADVKFGSASVGFGTAPTGITTLYHHITFANSYQSGNKLSFYTGKQSSGETTYRYDYINLDTYYNLKYEFSNSSVTPYVDGVQKGTYSNLSYLNGETRYLCWQEWDPGRTITAKNIKIKPL